MGMGHDLRDGSQSPVRVRQSSRWKSPSQRERSPERHKSSRRDGSPARKKRSGRDQSPKLEMPSAASPLARHRNSQRDRSPPARETNFTHAKSPMHEKSRSPSPRTKRLRRAQGERETENANDKDHGRNNGKGEDSGTHRGRRVKKMTERESERINIKGGEKQTQRESEVTDRDYERNHGRGSDKNSHRERGINRDTEVERKERKSGRDETDGKSSRARRVRSISPSDNRQRSRHKSRSPQLAAGARECDEMADARRAERQNSDDDSLAKMKTAEEALEAKQKQKPSFELSGKLAAETNRVRGVTLLFNEPPDARKADLRWQLFVFKGGELLNEPLYIHRQSCYLFGRERRVADIPTDHPSCSKQHAVLQFRQVEKEESDGALSKQVRPYLMDLGSTNKTFINDNPIEPQRYYELFEKDTIKFGNSSREYVLLHENSAG